MEIDKPKSQPYSEESEIGILGGILLDPEAWDSVCDLLSADDFYHSANKRVFKAIEKLKKANSPVDIVTVANALEDENSLVAIGGKPYLVDLVNRTHTTAHLEAYAKIVHEKAKLRQLIKTCKELTDKAYTADFTDVNSFLDSAEAAIYQVSQSKAVSSLVSAGQIIKDSIKRIEDLYHKKVSVTGIATGFSDLDKLTSGFHAGEMTILAARPSMGKTALSLNMAMHAALREKKKVAYFSVEMAKEQIMTRILAAEAKVNISDLRTGRVPDDAWPRLISAAATISQSSLFIDDTTGISPYEVRAKARRMKSQHGLDLIMIDYLQIMDLKQKVESRERAVAEISRTLKSIAKELSIPVIALAQLNRGVEGRGKAERKPMLSDLRESGSIEQDADLIMMLYRDEYYDRENPDVHGLADLLINKHRNGATGNIRLRWNPNIGRFSDIELDAKFLPPSPTPQSDRMPHSIPNTFVPKGNA